MHHLTRIVITLITNITISTSCTWLHNVTISAKPYQIDDIKSIKLDSCIQRTAFNSTIEAIEIRNESITKLGRDSIRHMVRLARFYLQNCRLNAIETGAFRNTPRLKRVEIVANNISHLPAQIFGNADVLELLGLSKNGIVSIDKSAFNNLTALRKIHLAYNSLETWEARWFFNAISLEVLDFRFNRIGELPDGAFGALATLKEIYFDHNEIKAIGAGAFHQLRNLKHLGLGSNRLKVLERGSFPNAISISQLAINANYLNFLGEEVRAVMSLARLQLEGNPWNCFCLDAVFVWLQKTNGSVVVAEQQCSRRDMPVCAYPANHSGRCGEMVDQGVTDTYLKEIGLLTPAVHKYCARLD